MRRHWKMLAIVATVAVTGLAVVAGASAATDPASPQSTGDACALADNPQALEEMQALRTEKQEAWQAWFEKYGTGTERGSAEAQAEKQQLREQYQSDMTALHETYGVEVPEGAGPGSRSGAGNGTMMGGGHGGGMGARGMTSDTSI